MTFDPKEALALVEKYRRKARAEMDSMCCGDCNDMRRSLRARADGYKHVADTITALLAENERLRVAVEEIAAPAAMAMDSADRVEALRDIARDALKGATDD